MSVCQNQCYFCISNILFINILNWLLFEIFPFHFNWFNLFVII